MRALMNSNYQHSFARKALPAQSPIPSNRPGVCACVLTGERDDDVN
jgi:hypothetical protein